jgi:hypothetical protein
VQSTKRKKHETTTTKFQYFGKDTLQTCENLYCQADTDDTRIDAATLYVITILVAYIVIRVIDT